MTVSIENQDIPWILSVINSFVDLGDTTVSLEAQGVKIEKSLPLNGRLRLIFSLYAKSGLLILDLEKSSVFGVGLFGVVRKKANDMIEKILKGHPNLTVQRDSGNLALSVVGYSVRQVFYTNGLLRLEVSRK